LGGADLAPVLVGLRFGIAIERLMLQAHLSASTISTASC
jgi:hypothetical protein